MRLVPLILLLSACDAQVDPSYPGEGLAHLRGSVVGLGVDEVADSVAVLWNANRGPDVPSGPMTSEPLHPRFPSSLTITVLAEPPEGAFFSVGGETARIAEGYLYLVAAGAGDPGPEDVVAASLDFVLVFVRGAVAPGSLTASYLGGVLAPGYHLLDWRATAELTEAQTGLAQACADEMVAHGAADRDEAFADCRWPRLYRLLPTAKDLDTPLLFYPRNGTKR